MEFSFFFSVHYLFTAKKFTQQADLAPISLKVIVMFIFGSLANKFPDHWSRGSFSNEKVPRKIFQPESYTRNSMGGAFSENGIVCKEFSWWGGGGVYMGGTFH